VSKDVSVKGMVLAAGLGTRLRPLTDRMPKALVPVGGRPMILHPLLWLRDQGVTEVVINLHYLGQMIEDELGDGSSLGMRIMYSREEELLGTGGGVGRAWRLVKASRMVLINADTLVKADLGHMIAFHQRTGAAATMVVTAEEGHYTPVMVDGEDRVRSIGGEPADRAGGDLRRVVFTGLSILGQPVLERLPDDRFACLVEDGIAPAILEGHTVSAYPYSGPWAALDTGEKIREAEKKFKF